MKKNIKHYPEENQREKRKEMNTNIVNNSKDLGKKNKEFVFEYIPNKNILRRMITVEDKWGNEVTNGVIWELAENGTIYSLNPNNNVNYENIKFMSPGKNGIGPCRISRREDFDSLIRDGGTRRGPRGIFSGFLVIDRNPLKALKSSILNWKSDEEGNMTVEVIFEEKEDYCLIRNEKEGKWEKENKENFSQNKKNFGDYERNNNSKRYNSNEGDDEW